MSNIRVKAKHIKDIPGVVEARQKQADKTDKINSTKNKSFVDLTQEEKDFLLQTLLERANLIKR